MKIELVPISSVKQDPKNARSHGDRNLAAITTSLKTFGQQKPIVVGRDGVVIVFSGRELIHGVTPINCRDKDGYRFSVVFYFLAPAADAGTPRHEADQARALRTKRESGMAMAIRAKVAESKAEKPHVLGSDPGAVMRLEASDTPSDQSSPQG